MEEKAIPRKCELCEKEVPKIHRYHLSYEEEKVIFLCASCHSLLHHYNLNSFTYDQIVKAKEWISRYGHEWLDGTKKKERRSYYLKHKETEVSSALSWKKENAEKNRETARKWKANNLEKARELNRLATKRYRDRKKLERSLK